MSTKKWVMLAVMLAVANTVAVTFLFVALGLAERRVEPPVEKPVVKEKIKPKDEFAVVPYKPLEKRIVEDWECAKVRKNQTKKPVVRKKQKKVKKKKWVRAPKPKKRIAKKSCTKKIICRKYRPGTCCRKPDVTSKPAVLEQWYRYDQVRKVWVFRG